MKKLLIIFGIVSTNVTAQSLPTIEQCQQLFLKEITDKDVNECAFVDKKRDTDTSDFYHVGCGSRYIYHYITKGKEMSFMFMMKDKEWATKTYSEYCKDLLTFNEGRSKNVWDKGAGSQWLISYNMKDDITIVVELKGTYVYVKLKDVK